MNGVTFFFFDPQFLKKSDSIYLFCKRFQDEREKKESFGMWRIHDTAEVSRDLCITTRSFSSAILLKDAPSQWR